LKLLLDTHIWLWILEDPGRLGRRLHAELRSGDHELWLSPVSVWEALLLNRKGRIRLEEDLRAWFDDATARFQEAPLTHEIVFAAHRLPLLPDPADRFLAATAQVLELTLVTADERLLGLGKIRTLANR
jgi:PIN domain nuclease of toxin-antitoxin system